MSFKINKIQNAGILRLDKEIELGKYSLFYGYNGSGKTTLSRLFDLLGTTDRKQTIIDDISNGGEIVFKVNDKNYNDSTNEFLNNIKVFNKDFIEREVFAPKGMAKIILGKPNADFHKKLKELQDLKSGIEKLNEEFAAKKEIVFNGTTYKGIENLNNEKQNIEKSIDSLSINYARSIKKEFGGNFINYDKAVLNKKVKEVSTDIDKIKQESGYDNNWTDIFKVAKAEMNKLAIGRTIQKEKFEKIKTFKKQILELNFQSINDLLQKPVTIPDEEIKSITSNDIKNWIKDGIKHHNDTNKCYFCSSDLGVGRLDKLRDAFSGDYEKLEIELKDKKNILDKTKEPIQSFKPVEYDEIKNDIDNTKVMQLIDKFLEQIQAKLNKLEEPSDTVLINTEIESFEQQLDDLLSEYEAFNNAQKDTEKEYLKIEKWLAVAFLEDKSETSYTKLKQRELQITNTLKNVYLEKAGIIKGKLKNTQDKLKSEGINVVLNEVSHIDAEITSATQSIANVDLAIDEIKNHFSSIIDTNIDIQYNEDDKSFVIKRGVKNAMKTLSEGERTALAFSYFLTTFDKNNGIPLSQIEEKKLSIVIDDPISSLDYNVLYGIYNKIYHYVYKIKGEGNTSRKRDFKNIVILTHNFYFANLIIKGFELEKHNQPKNNEYAVYEIKRINKTESNIIIFEHLNYFTNEYDYLLDQIVQSYDYNINTFDIYSLGNACRRFIELYCKFNTRNGKIEDLDIFKDNNALLRFLHLSSHGEIMPDKNSIHIQASDVSGFIKTILDELAKNNPKIKDKIDVKKGQELRNSY